MARVYEERHCVQWSVGVPVDVLWEYILDRDAQVRLDPRIESIEIESGQWGAPGSVMILTARGPKGAVGTLRHVLEASVPPHFYRTRSQTPDVTIVDSVSTEPEGEGTRVTARTDVVTRPLTWLEHLLVKRGRPGRAAQAEAAAITAREAVEAFAAERA